MHTAQFIKLVTVAGWLWVSQGNLVRSEQVGLIAQASTACQVNSLDPNGGLSTTIGTPPTGLRGTILISVTCPSGVGGNLQLSLSPTVVNNGGATMKFVSSAGALTGASTTASTGIINVLVLATGLRTGTGSIQVDIANSSGKLLKSASDYKLVVTADFN